MKILCVIPVSREDAARAELLLDLIYQLEGRVSKESCLLVFAPEVHQEMKDKLTLAAKLAFSSVDTFSLQTLMVAKNEKPSIVWAMFFNTAQHVSENYRWPWLWLEPDCMPVQPGWREKLWQAYDNQPKRYLSRRMKAGEATFCHRVGVYPASIMRDIQISQTAEVPFETSIVEHSTSCDLFQQVAIADKNEVARIRQDAVLIHHDKLGVLADWVRELAVKSIPNPEWVNAPYEIDMTPPDLINVGPPPINANGARLIQIENPAAEPKRRGRPPKQQSVRATV